jgi:outer membrane protein TolC
MILDINTIQQMLVRNIEVKIKQVEIDDQRGRAEGYYKSFAPRLYLFQGIQAERGTEKKTFSGSGVGLNLNLYDGGRDYNFSKASISRAERFRLDQQIKLQELTLKGQEIYLDLLRMDELQKINSDYRSLNAENINLVSRKVKSGLLHENELLSFKLISADIEDEEKDHKNERQKNIIDLSTLLNSELIDVETSAIDFDKISLKNQFPEKMYELELKSFFEAKEEINWEGKNTDFWSRMQVNFYTEYSFTKNNLGENLPETNDASKVFGLKVTWDLFDLKSEKSQEAQNLSYQMIKESLMQEKMESEYKNKKSKENLDLAFIEDKVTRLELRLELNQKIYATTVSGFKNGLKDASNLKEALADLIQTKRDIVNAKIQRLKLLNEQNK